MQITNADIIKNGEQDLIDAITADLDWGAIENIFREQHNLGIDEDVEYKQGDIVVHGNQIAYQLQFEVKVTVSVLLDRAGNYLSVSFSGNSENDQDETASYNIRNDGYVVIQFDSSVSEKNYTKVVEQLRSNNNIPGVWAEQNGVEVCPLR